MNTPSDDLIAISQFVVESERNLSIAHSIYQQFEAAREQLVLGFCQRLAADLEARLPEWKCDYTSNPLFVERWGSVDLAKPGWRGVYRVRLEAYNWGEKMAFGLHRNEELLNGTAFRKELLLAIKKFYPEARSRSWFEAEIAMTSPAAHWLTPPILWRMHSDETFRREVAAHLLCVAEVAEPYCDELVRSSS